MASTGAPIRWAGSATNGIAPGGRRPREGNGAELLRARSASVALASGGDRAYLYDFVGHMAGQIDEMANLNYWAYWIGELSDEQVSDTFMLTADTRSWTGVRLLPHLLQRLDPGLPICR